MWTALFVLLILYFGTGIIVNLVEMFKFFKERE